MNFEDKLNYIRSNKKVDYTKFNSADEITKMIDFHNQSVENDKDKRAENEVREISKFLARIQGRKMFFMNPKVKGII